MTFRDIFQGNRDFGHIRIFWGNLFCKPFSFATEREILRAASMPQPRKPHFFSFAFGSIFVTFRDIWPAPEQRNFDVGTKMLKKSETVTRYLSGHKILSANSQ